MSEKGSTLIEIIIAVTILALITVPICALLSESVYSNLKVKEMMAATALAQDTIEELKADSFNEIMAKLGERREERIEFNNHYFQRSIKVQIKKENLLKITVKVKGENGEINIATYRGKY